MNDTDRIVHRALDTFADYIAAAFTIGLAVGLVVGWLS